MRVVASLTTMPDRYERLERTLKTIFTQTYKLDAIYLSLPKVSYRLNIEYPPLPDSILKMCTVVECEDYGPITKILGALIAEKDPNTIIITFDDDMVYPNNIVESLIAKHKAYPNMAIGSSGMLVKYSCPMCAINPNQNDLIFSIPKFEIPIEGRKVDSVYGYPGALYLRGFFPENNVKFVRRVYYDEGYAFGEDVPYPAHGLDSFLLYACISKELWMNDDITISGWLSLKGIERRIFPGMPCVGFIRDENGEVIQTGNEISYNLDTFFKRLNTSISQAKRMGMFSETEEMGNSETIAGLSFTIIVALIGLGLGIWYLIKNGLSLPFR